MAGVTEKKKVISLFSHMLSFHLHCTTQFWTHYVPSATVSLSTRLWLGVEVLERNVQPAGDLLGEGWRGGSGGGTLRMVLTGQ